MRAALAAAEASISSGRSGGDSGTKSVQAQNRKRKIVSRTAGTLQVLASRTWTSFSPSETRLTICVRASLSGLGLIWYWASKMAWSSGLLFCIELSWLDFGGSPRVHHSDSRHTSSDVAFGEQAACCRLGVVDFASRSFESERGRRRSRHWSRRLVETARTRPPLKAPGRTWSIGL